MAAALLVVSGCGGLLAPGSAASARPRSAPRQSSVAMGLLSRFRRPKPCGTLVSEATPCCPGVHRGLVTRSRTHTGARATRRDDVGRPGQVHGLGRPAPEQQGPDAVRRGRDCAAGERRDREIQGRYRRDIGGTQCDEAAIALQASGYTFDVAYTSMLKRAVETTWLLLKELD